MKNIFKLILISFMINVCINGCTQWPTEKQSISDMRPGISFKAQSTELLEGRVILDSLDMGSARNYQEGSAMLRILPGPHLLVISLNGRKIFEEKIYASDGVNQTFLIH
jgi:hypothetical protein